MERERNGSSVREGGEGSVSAFFKRKGVVILSPTTKIFILENELTNKETRV